jgi:hypothetical protein
MLTALSADFCRLNETTFTGHAFWRPNALRRLAIELLLDGEPMGLVRADQFERQLFTSGCGDGCYGFTFIADRDQLLGHRTIEARLANMDVAIGRPIDLAVDSIRTDQAARVGSVEWVGGARLVGSIRSDGQAEQTVQVYQNEVLVSESCARRWSAGRLAIRGSDAFLFDIHLPMAFADGEPHVICVRSGEGQELDGSPLTIQSFNEGLQRLVKGAPGFGEEDALAKWFDRFLPSSIPFQSYDEWSRRFPPNVTASKQDQKMYVVLVGDSADEQSIQRLLQQNHGAWQAVVVPSSDGVMFDWADLQEALAADPDDLDMVVFASATAVLRPHALTALADALVAHVDAFAAYGDLEIVNSEGYAQPAFFGAFDYERLLEQGYAAHCFAVRSDAISIPREEQTGSLARFFMSLFDNSAPENFQKVLHVPGVLASIGTADVLAAASA